MTNAEHLIENAMMAFKRDFERKENDDKYRKSFFSSEMNIDMAKENGINLEDVWDMAQYVWMDWLRDPSTINELYKELHTDDDKEDEPEKKPVPSAKISSDDALGYEIARNINYSGVCLTNDMYTRNNTVYSLVFASTSIYMVAMHNDKDDTYAFISDIYPKSKNFGKTFVVPHIIVSINGDKHKYVNKTATVNVYDLTDGFYVQIHTIDGEDYMIHMAHNTFGEVIGEVKEMNSYIEDKMIGFTWYADYTTRND